MKIIQPSVEAVSPMSRGELLRKLEAAGRTCYKSESKIAEGTAQSFLRNIIKSGHESVLEHGSVTLRIICDRGVSHELVRHRIASYSQESTRYCRYDKEKFGSEITVIAPYPEMTNEQMAVWMDAMCFAEEKYMELLAAGCTAQEARGVLPTALKTEIVMTANIREWRLFLKTRLSPACHPQMIQVAGLILSELRGLYPILFDDIGGDLS